jgi:histidine ammonia-lyase
MSDSIRIDGQSLDLNAVAAVARHGARTFMPARARAEMLRSHAWVDRAARGEIRGADGEPMAVYGVNTGYGSLARIRIAQDQIQALSWNLVRSHAAGVGPSLPAEAVRGMMLLRANALAKGASGCRPELVDTLLGMLREGVVPDVPEQGSCGSSGDLAPLSHLALVVFRGPQESDEESGWAWYRGERMRGAKAMALAGLTRLVPGPKEGLAMNNGAQLTTSLAALACVDSIELIKVAEIAAAMCWEALRGVTRALHPGVHRLRPYAGAIACASNLRRLMRGSELVDSMPFKVQDAYSIRCTPQIMGAVRDGTRFAADQISVELNSATDNPVILLESDDVNKAFSAGLFHGEPVGMAADHLKLAISELAALSERRIYRLTTGTLSSRLPPLLALGDRPTLGLMVPQTTAAALVATNRSLQWPSSADSIPTCEDQEDVVAMSTTAARRAREVVGNSRYVVAIELLTAAAALRSRLSEEPNLVLGEGTRAAFDLIDPLIDGVVPSDDIVSLHSLIVDGTLAACVQNVVGPLEGVHGG